MEGSLRGSETERLLREEFARMSMERSRYLHFASKADMEGQTDAAALFRTVAEGTGTSARGCLEFLEASGDTETRMPFGRTEDCLKSAIAGETREWMEAAPALERAARREGFDEIADWVEMMAKARRLRANRFQKEPNRLGG